MGRGHRTRSHPGPGVLPPLPLSPSPCSPFPQICVLGPKEQMYSFPAWGTRVQNQGAGRTHHPKASRVSLQASPPEAANGRRACCPSACSRPPEEVPSSGSNHVSRVSCKDTREFRTPGAGGPHRNASLQRFHTRTHWRLRVAMNLGSHRSAHFTRRPRGGSRLLCSPRGF